LEKDILGSRDFSLPGNDTVVKQALFCIDKIALSTVIVNCVFVQEHGSDKLPA